MILVEDLYDLDEDLMYAKSRDSDYWKDSLDFYLEVQTRHLNTLSISQKEWLEKMHTSLEACENNS